MGQTFRAVFQRVDVLPMTDILASVFNNEQTEQRRYYEVTKVSVRPIGPFAGLTGTSPLAAKLGLYRTTATVGGTAVAAIERDTDSAALPAQVTCTTFPSSVTTTGAALRTMADAPSLAFAGSNQWTSARVYGGSYYAYQRGNAADLLRQGGDSNVELIVLREGEGVALTLDGYGWPRSQQINITVRNMSSGATYQFRSREIATPYLTGQAIISLFNGSGSGVVLGVYASEFPLDGESNFPVFRLARIDAASGGEAVTPIAADSVNEVPASLVCAGSDGIARLAGQTQGVLYDWNTTHGASISVAVQQRMGVVRGVTGIRPFWDVGKTPGFQTGQEETVLFQESAGNGIILRPQEGFALLAGRGGAIETSTFATFDVEMTIIHYPPTSGQYSRARVVNA